MSDWTATDHDGRKYVEVRFKIARDLLHDDALDLREYVADICMGILKPDPRESEGA